MLPRLERALLRDRRRVIHAAAAGSVVFYCKLVLDMVLKTTTIALLYRRHHKDNLSCWRQGFFLSILVRSLSQITRKNWSAMMQYALLC